MSKRWISYVIAGLLLSYAGYAWFDFQARHGEKALLERAHRYWEARRLNDWHTAYQMETEAINGSLMPHEVDTRPEWGMRVFSFELGPVVHHNDQAEITVKPQSIMKESFTPLKMGTRQDRWTFTRGQWYHGVPDPGSSDLRYRGLPMEDNVGKAPPGL